MNTPILDFVNRYKQSNPIRFHMPAHKGEIQGTQMDITEIDGADSLFDAKGIIDQSEKNLSELYNTNFSVYSTEGSTLAIKTMIALICTYANDKRQRPLILATRNAHSSFLYGVGLLDVDVEWIIEQNACFLCSKVDEIIVEKKLKEMQTLPTALYLTCPDYLGNMLPIEKIAKVCQKYGVLLAVDNAHGAYLNFLKENLHPINLGADMCSDSAHKTLPTLTGGAYLHMSKRFDYFCKDKVKKAMKAFASTSPSYLILCSLDWTNRYIYENKDAFETCKQKVEEIKEFCLGLGFELIGQEPLKITLNCNSYGYFATEIVQKLRKENIVVEYYDKNYLVLMFSPLNTDKDYQRLKSVLSNIEKREMITIPTFNPINLERKMSIKQALFSSEELIDVDNAEGRILSSINVSCPPAVPIVISGEQIDKNAISVMKYYGVEKCFVVKNK